MLIALPTFSSGATVKNDLRSFAPAPTPRVGPADRAEIKPPLHGTNPHGQGTAAVIDLNPDATRPLTVDENGTAASEDIVIGRSRGEQRADGRYHGHVTVAALFGNEIIAGADTNPGDAPVDEAIADDLLNGLCTVSRICIDAARVRSATTSAGSINSFSLATLALGGPVTTPGLPVVDPPALTIRAAESSGNIVTDGVCQTATGFSNVADLSAGAGAAIADVAESTSRSRACRGGAREQGNTSKVIELGGTGLSLPLLNLVPDGCADGIPDTEGGLPALLPIVCNADDSSATNPAGNQAAAPYGVRHALDVYVLAVPGISALAQVSTAQSESLAVAPAAVTTPTTVTTTTPTVTPPTTTPTPAATTPVIPTTTPTTPTPGATPTPDATPTPGEDDAGGDDEAGNEGAGDDGAGDGTPECSDGVDNDGDGKIDFGSDPGCSSADDDSEANAVSLAGNELPFTGTDVVVLGLAGSILLAAGLTLRGPARRREFDEA